MKTMKSFLALFLAIVLINSLIPNSVYSLTEKVVYLPVSDGEAYEYLHVLSSNGEVFISGEDLAHLTGYKYYSNQKNAEFKRGSKSVKIDITKRTIEVFSNLSQIKIKQVLVRDKIYFPLTEMLPWLNVNVYENDGVLFIIRDKKSIWDFIHDFDLNDYSFDFNKEFADAEKNSLWAKTISFFSRKSTDVLKHMMPFAWGATVGSKDDYYELLEEMLQNKDTAIYAAHNFIKDDVKDIKVLTDYLKYGALIPDEFNVWIPVLDTFEGINYLTEYMVYYVTFYQNNEATLEMIDDMTLWRNYAPVNNSMMAAMFDIQDSYSDHLRGLETKFLNWGVQISLDLLMKTNPYTEGAKMILDQFGFFSGGNENKIDLTVKYTALQEHARALYIYHDNANSPERLRAKKHAAMFYLYFAEKNYTTMKHYYISINNMEKAKSYDSIIMKCQEMYTLFLSAKDAETNDSFRYGNGFLKEDYTNTISQLLKKVDIVEYVDSKRNFVAGSDEASKTANLYGNTPGNINNQGFATIQGQWIYYTNGNYDEAKIYKIRTDGTEQAVIIDDYGWYINVVGDWIYYDNGSDLNKIYKIRTDGTGRTKINNDISRSVNVVNDWVYYTNSDDDDKIYKIRTDGTGRTKISDDSTWFLNVVGDWVYYVNQSDWKSIYRIRTDGTGHTKINDDSSWGINVVGEWIYYTFAFDGRIYKIHTDGTGKERINNDISSSVNVVNDWVYYTNSDDGYKIYKIRTDGTERTKINDDNSGEINVVGDWIYYRTLAQDAPIYKIRTDGSGRQPVK